MPKLHLKQKVTVEPVEWVKTIDHRGKGALGGETLKTLPGFSERPHGTPRPSGTPGHQKRSAGGAIGSTGEEFGGP